jgi:hypothetical protein
LYWLMTSAGEYREKAGYSRTDLLECVVVRK